ncbi:MAG: hypothetical protein VZQ99_10460, partial [Treponema sp.]|nr:hypothetical protein [Treponema sp.]
KLRAMSCVPASAKINYVHFKSSYISAVRARQLASADVAAYAASLDYGLSTAFIAAGPPNITAVRASLAASANVAAYAASFDLGLASKLVAAGPPIITAVRAR